MVYALSLHAYRVNHSSPAIFEAFFRVGFNSTDTEYGLVDSGADYSILPFRFAKTLHINIREGKPWNFRGTTGVLQLAWRHPVEISIWSPDNSSVTFRFDTEASFCEDFGFPGAFLLGQVGFFSLFTTSFNPAENWFDLEPHDDRMYVQPPLLAKSARP